MQDDLNLDPKPTPTGDDSLPGGPPIDSPQAPPEAEIIDSPEPAPELPSRH
jgi:hypothetical protein